jgi:hypothetical protein
MSRRTRVFLAVAGAILAIGLGVGFVASLLGGPLSLTGTRGPAEFAYLPLDTRLVAYADVRGIMDSELRRRLTSATPNSGEATRRFREETGIDLERDIEHVVAAWTGDAGVDATIVLLRGNLDQARIEGLIGRQGIREEHGGYSLFTAGEHLTVAFLEPGLVAVGRTTAVQSAIDVAAGRTDVRDNDEIMSLVRDVRDGQVWVVARFDELTAGHIPPDVARQLPAISWISLAGFVDAGVQGRLRVEARDEAAARNLREVIQGFLALARMQGGSQPVVGDILASLQLTGQGTTVSLSFAIPPEVIELLGAMRALQPPGAPGSPFPGL